MNLRPRYPTQAAVAVIAAFLLWYALAAKRSENLSVRWIRAPLNLLHLPPELELTSRVQDSVSVQVRGPLGWTPDPRNPVEIVLDLAEAGPGKTAYPIEASAVRLPGGLELVDVEPAAIELELEQVLTRLLPVRVHLVGEAASGFVVQEVQVVPSRVTVQGPRSRLDELEVVETTSVSVEGATTSFAVSAEPRFADRLLRSLDVAPLEVTVIMAPTEVEDLNGLEETEPS